ncbi:hypothetical protein PLESTB_000106700 [Pleodorina starrii]|uniref:Uncharacterized protein n=1 Tax=Pleodorina starrii TaxID=330485 RepID=A0A9W6BBC6_9CHLO|nr:hypothetical protein PLESTB_000106700 [Pleodorina starrii]
MADIGKTSTTAATATSLPPTPIAITNETPTSISGSTSGNGSSLEVNTGSPPVSVVTAGSASGDDSTADTLPTLEELLTLGSMASEQGGGALNAGAQMWYRWVAVDISPPTVSGALFVSNSTVPLSASTDGVVQQLRYLLVQLNMSEPVRQFNMKTTLQLGGGAALMASDCFESSDAAAEVMAAAAVTAAVVEGVPPPSATPPPPPPASKLRSRIGSPKSSSTAPPGQQYIRSCVAVLYAAEGSTTSVTLPEGAVMDVKGNPNDRGTSMKLQQQQQQQQQQ